MRFKEFFLYKEASVLPSDNQRQRKFNSPDVQKPLKDSDTIRVYHGFNNINDLFQALKSGISGQEKAKRIYSYEGNNNPNGIFVTISLNVAKQFGQYIMEIHAPVKDLEAPVWPGGGYTVQGGMAEYFDGPEDREKQRMKAREYSSQSKHDSIKNSDRPELAELLFNSSEQQALFVGNLNNNSIRAIWANPTPDKCGSYCTYKRMSVKEFLKNYKPSAEFKPQHTHRILNPRDTFDIHKFVDILIKEYSGKKYSMSKEDIINSLKGLNERDWLTYIWPAQLPDALKQIQEV